MQQLLDDHKSSLFWLENVGNLFSSGSMIPLSTDSFEEQMNALTRFVLLIFIFLSFFKSSKYAVTISSLCLSLIGITYYTGKGLWGKKIKETYGNVASAQEPIMTVPKYTATNNFVITPTYNQVQKCRTELPTTGDLVISETATNPQLIDGRVSSYWQYQDVPIQDTVSNNQKLVGGPNPKTLVQPIIPSPAYDNQVWQPNDFVVPSGINQQQRQELYSNGYIATGDTVLNPPKTMENYIPPAENDQIKLEKPGGLLKYSEHKIEEYKNHQMQRNRQLNQQSNNNYTTTKDDLVDFGCGYQPLNLQSNLPSNYMAPTCQTGPNNAEYNENLYSIPLQPGLYTKSQVNQPDASMSNLGISYNQQFLPTVFENKKNYQAIVELDPYQNPSVKENFASPQEPFRRDIYDPRLTGYGTSYRSYLDPVTGQTRFYYRDIDQQTQNGYVTRNNIDFANFGTRTGAYPFDKPLEGNALHQFADNTYTDSQIGYRSELQQRLMHKNSSREWQQRVAPIRTNQQTKGFMGTNSSKNYAGPRGG